MKELSYEQFAEGTERALKQRRPLSGQIELTYRCSLDCVHCYLKGIDCDESKELTTTELKYVLDQIHQQGCLWLCFTGGDPLAREDFLEIYTYARNKGFLITIFTNGTLLSSEVISYLEKSPPFQIEITLNGVCKKTYEEITQTDGSFEQAKQAIELLARRKLPLVIKANGLRQNKDEILNIKVYTENLLGKGKFKFDSYIFPQLDGGKDPLKHRLEPEEIITFELQDSDMVAQRVKQYHNPYPLERDPQYIYQCSSWLTQFFINPYGRLGFCHLTDNFSVRLREKSFQEGFYQVFPQLLEEKFKTNSKCSTCNLREECFWCPARAWLEVGDEEQPVDYFCQLAKARVKQRETLCKS